jgi:hypothetical protein
MITGGAVPLPAATHPQHHLPVALRLTSPSTRLELVH